MCNGERFGQHTDAVGRTGTAIQDPSSGDVVVIDTVTGTLLETETIATGKTHFRGVPPGTVTGAVTYVTVAVVNAEGSTPS